MLKRKNPVYERKWMRVIAMNSKYKKKGTKY